jgi:hypothetical protein
VAWLELPGMQLTMVHVVESLLGPEFPVPVYLSPAVEMRVRGEDKVERRVPVYLHDARMTIRVDLRHWHPELVRMGIVRKHALRGYIPFVSMDVARAIDHLVTEARRGRTVYSSTSLFGRAKGLIRTLESPAVRPVRLPAR